MSAFFKSGRRWRGKTNKRTIEDKEEAPAAETNSRQIKILNAAIPFLDREYQKGLFFIVKFMEFAAFSNQRGGVIEAQSIVKKDKNENRRMFLKAIRPLFKQKRAKSTGHFCACSGDEKIDGEGKSILKRGNHMNDNFFQEQGVSVHMSRKK